MIKLEKNDIDNAADILKRQHADVRTDTFLKFTATLDLFSRFLDLQYTSKSSTRSGFNVLNTLVLSGGSMSPTDLSKILFRSKNAIGHVVSTLESRGFVTTIPADEDRRSIEVHITAKGLALTKKESILVRERLGQLVFGILDDDEMKCLNGILAKLMQRTQQVMGEPD